MTLTVQLRPDDQLPLVQTVQAHWEAGAREHESPEEMKKRKGREAAKRWRDKYPEKAAAATRAYKDRQGEKFLAKHRETMRNRRRADPARAKEIASASYRKHHKKRRETAKLRYREVYAQNPNRWLIPNKQWRLQNPEKSKAAFRLWAEANPEKRRSYSRKYAATERGRLMSRVQSAKYRAQKLKATPAWANHEIIRQVYELAAFMTGETGEQWHVDHEVPLLSDRVCGLHWEGNLRILPASENISKSNRYWNNM